MPSSVLLTVARKGYHHQVNRVILCAFAVCFIGLFVKTSKLLEILCKWIFEFVFY